MNKHKLIIVGAGGFGRELYSFLWDCFSKDEYEVKGFLGKDPLQLEGLGIDFDVLGDPETYQPLEEDRFLLAIGNMPARRRVVEAIAAKGGRFLTMVHPSAYVSPGAKIGEGSIVYPFACVSNMADLNDYVHLSIYASMGHDSRAGRFCLLAPYATLNGFSYLEDEVYVSTHSTVAPEIRVGAQTKISANSVVMQNTPARSFVYGVPGKATTLIEAD